MVVCFADKHVVTVGLKEKESGGYTELQIGGDLSGPRRSSGSTRRNEEALITLHVAGNPSKCLSLPNAIILTPFHPRPIMSLSIDDLVSSLSSSHIGQEAMDIAALQAQLAQTLAQAIQQSASGQYTQRANRAQTCNTPIAQTPSSSMSFADAQRFYETVPRRGSQHDDYPYPATEQMEEDERMVEDLLMPQSSSATNGASSFEQHAYQNHSPSYTYTSPFTNDPYPNSSFATTDPFYQQAAKSHSMNTSPSSIFSQAGRPSHHSPFLAAQKQK
ncbi:hypothetical protein CCMSSC00406_0005398 [Pleurotus cornucopiae]|uniref:Uncharacterized protein n=1 Tax=Pleurotus cornucopiae TaxID=5321 RepID=A0ACB7IPU4_PLECO|nr:hypothetical protein CCMSSC00406_0005398 [Pleurotus cornucopiae]